MSDTVLLAVQDQIATITLNRPKVFNAMNEEMGAALRMAAAVKLFEMGQLSSGAAAFLPRASLGALRLSRAEAMLAAPCCRFDSTTSPRCGPRSVSPLGRSARRCGSLRR